MGYMTLITFNLPLVFLERLPIIEKCLSTPHVLITKYYTDTLSQYSGGDCWIHWIK